jgi:hypothetical protein
VADRASFLSKLLKQQKISNVLMMKMITMKVGGEKLVTKNHTMFLKTGTI